MSAHPPMPPARRRPIPGMPAHTAAPASAPSTDTRTAAATRLAEASAPVVDHGLARLPAAQPNGAVTRRPAMDYAATRLVNFRLPIDLHDRYKQLVRDVELRYPRLRHPSLTELVIALLEEGPADADGAAQLIGRKRAAEHQVQP